MIAILDTTLKYYRADINYYTWRSLLYLQYYTYNVHSNSIYNTF